MPSAPETATHRCPRCGAVVRWRDNAQRPFCSLACRLSDLGAWLDERYRIAGLEIASASAPDDDAARDG